MEERTTTTAEELLRQLSFSPLLENNDAKVPDVRIQTGTPWRDDESSSEKDNNNPEDEERLLEWFEDDDNVLGDLDSDMDDDEEEEETRSGKCLQELLAGRIEIKATCLLERFSNDVMAVILCHLSLQDIGCVSQVSRSLYRACRSDILWKNLFDFRFNVPVCDQSWLDNDYFQAYQRAYLHPHDLWITHWNLVYPADGLSPGRCCLPSKIPVEEAKQSRGSDLSSRRAFSRAATMHRQLHLPQFRPGPTNFLSDTLFFNLTDAATSIGHWELQQLLQEALEQQQQQHLDARENRVAAAHETSHHSWHILRLTNPDFHRPLIYQFGVQRPDCFTVYPSEGYIPPGTSCCVTVGVRPFGSALAYATEALNAQREALLEPRFVDLYADQAHLPLAPFLVRYRFALTHPRGTEGTDWDPRKRPTTSWYQHQETTTATAATRQPDLHTLLQHHWQQNVPLYQIRSIHLSAHVNAHFLFNDMCRFTCRPFDTQRDVGGPIWVAPHLQELYPAVFSSLQPSRLDISCSNGKREAWYRERATEMHQHHSTTVINKHRNQRQRMLCNVRRCVQLLADGKCPGEAVHLSTLLCTLFHVLHGIKAAPWTGTDQRRVLVQWELVMDELYSQIPIGGEDWHAWRIKGVYRYTVCTDSVFGGPVVCDSGKDEPRYLDTFRHLAHSPGRFCLGRQEDPNHEVPKALICASQRFAREQSGMVSDMFMDNPISALQAGICMIRDPRSLFVHGLYDLHPYPGTLTRRPWMTCQVSSPSFAAHTADIHYGLLRYLHGAPPPGVGRFALSKFGFAPGRDGESPSINEFRLEDESSDNSNVARGEEVAEHGRHVMRVRRPHARVNMPGVHLLRLLWSLGTQLGLAMENTDASLVFVNRNILIASQWISISLMIVPLFWTLCARYSSLIPSQPVDYNLDGFPIEISNEMRFLTEKECGYVAVFLIFLWCALGRWSERRTERDYFRIMLEHLPPLTGNTTRIGRIKARIYEFGLRRLDAVCPLFLQRRVFNPHWNRRTHRDLIKHIAFWRSQKLDEQRATSRIAAIGWTRTSPTPLFGDHRDEGIEVGYESSARKVLTGVIVALGSFCASSPHFWLNAATVFSCSISLGMSVSLHSMEIGRWSFSLSNTGSVLKELNLLTVVIMSFLIGQLIGSSGGTMFLAEFVVTSVSLILGGTGTFSVSTLESWGCFLCLSCTSFWGYLFGRVALMDGIRQKRSSYSSVLLSHAIMLLFIFWLFVFVVVRFDSHVNVVVERPPSDKEMRDWTRNYAGKRLQ